MDLRLRRRTVHSGIPLLYVMCDGCYDVTAHLRCCVTTVSLPAGHPSRHSSLLEVVCCACGWSQPRVIGDEVTPRLVLQCRKRRRRLRRRCQKRFSAPDNVSWPTCPWCGAIARPVLD